MAYIMSALGFGLFAHTWDLRQLTIKIRMELNCKNFLAIWLNFHIRRYALKALVQNILCGMSKRAFLLKPHVIGANLLTMMAWSILFPNEYGPQTPPSSKFTSNSDISEVHILDIFGSYIDGYRAIAKYVHDSLFFRALSISLTKFFAITQAMFWNLAYRQFGP